MHAIRLDAERLEGVVLGGYVSGVRGVTTQAELLPRYRLAWKAQAVLGRASESQCRVSRKAQRADVN